MPYKKSIIFQKTDLKLLYLSKILEKVNVILKIENYFKQGYSNMSNIINFY